jgi:PAS domain S-box-containing protein
MIELCRPGPTGRRARGSKYGDFLFFPSSDVFDALPVPATLIDRQGVIVDVNQAFLDYASNLLGSEVRKAARIGRHITEFSPTKPGRSPIATIVEQVLHSGEVHLRETQWTDPRGRTLYVDFHAKAIRDDNGEVEGAVILRQDVTERVHLKKRKQVVEEVRQQVWQIQEEADIEQVLATMERALRQEIPFAGLGINVVDTNFDPSRVRYFERSPTGSGERWNFADSEEDKAAMA